MKIKNPAIKVIFIFVLFVVISITVMTVRAIIEINDENSYIFDLNKYTEEMILGKDKDYTKFMSKSSKGETEDGLPRFLFACHKAGWLFTAFQFEIKGNGEQYEIKGDSESGEVRFFVIKDGNKIIKELGKGEVYNLQGNAGEQYTVKVACSGVKNLEVTAVSQKV